MPEAVNGTTRIHYDTKGDREDPSILLIMGYTEPMTSFKEGFCQLGQKYRLTEDNDLKRRRLDEATKGRCKNGPELPEIPVIRERERKKDKGRGDGDPNKIWVKVQKP